MEKFKDIIYSRPDFQLEKENLQSYVSKIKNASTYTELRQAVLEREEQEQEYNFMYDLAFIRNSINALDEFYDKELAFMNDKEGERALLKQECSRALLESPFIEEFRQDFGNKMVGRMQMELKLASPEILEELKKEAELKQEYSRVVSACSVEFEGQTCNFNGLLKFMQDLDRSKRKAAFELWAGMYESISGQLDAIYDQMVQVRSEIAEKLGFDNYISYIFAEKGRAYQPQDVKAFYEHVKNYIVPLCEKNFKSQKERLGLDTLAWYDESLTDPDGSATPKGNAEELLKKAKVMYHQLSERTGEFIDFMLEHELFDLEGRLGKQPGGFCRTLKKEKAPFIFANFNETSDDVYVLTHEAGHAFESYVAGRIYPLASMVEAGSEINEIHAMAMELFTYPWMEMFFEENADKYRLRHLQKNLSAVPYMVCVDALQTRTFEEHLDAEGRRRVWKELEKIYLPWRTYDGNEFLENGGFWMQKLHIFLYPFYYIEYPLAQMGAFEFYRKMCTEPEAAWNDYYGLCQAGGKYLYYDTLKGAGLNSPFEEDTVKNIAEFLEQKIMEMEGGKQ